MVCCCVQELLIMKVFFYYNWHTVYSIHDELCYAMHPFSNNNNNNSIY